MMQAPWQCPDCRIWLAPGTQSHRCADADYDRNPALNGQVAQEVLGSVLRTKDGRQAYNLGYPEGFLKFWSIYPLHRDKRKALKAWRNAILRATQDEINEGALRYRNDPNRLPQFTKYAEGWLNGDNWTSDPLPERLAPGALPAVGLPESQEDIDAKIATYLGEQT